MKFFTLSPCFQVCIFLAWPGDVSAQARFQVAYGGAGGQTVYDLRQTADGGYAVAGETDSYGSGNLDAYLVRTDALGNALWGMAYGGAGWDYGYGMDITADGGFVITGSTTSFAGTTAYLIKTGSNGSLQWSVIIGVGSGDEGRSVQQTTDSGFVMTGSTKSYGTGTPLYANVYLVKTNGSGAVQWTSTFGGTNEDNGFYVQQTADGGFIISGFTQTFGAGSGDIYVLKTDVNGALSWSCTYGSTNSAAYDDSRCIRQTTDGGYILTGQTGSGAGFGDSYLLKISSDGAQQWFRTFGGTRNDYAHGVQVASDGGYLVAGYRTTCLFCYSENFLLKTDAAGTVQWSRSYGGTGDEWGLTGRQTADGGFIIGGETASFGPGTGSIYLVKTDGNGFSGCNENAITLVVNTPAFSGSSPATSSGSGFSAGNPPTAAVNGIGSNILCQLLPVQMLNFTAVFLVTDEAVLLNLQATDDSQTGYYVIESGADGRKFSEIARIIRQNNGMADRKYSFTDRNIPVKGPAGRREDSYPVYYRLSAADYDGNYTYSDIVSLSVGLRVNRGFSITHIYAIEGVSEVRFTLPAEGAVSYAILDAAGRGALSGSFGRMQRGNHSVSISTSGLPAGIYCLILRSDEGLYVSGRILL